MKKILILGCGWVGEEFAHLQLKNNWQVWATSTNEEKYHRLKADGIFAYIHDFDQETDLNEVELPAFDAVLCSIPATQKNSLEQLEARFNRVKAYLEKVNYAKLIFLSSIGIFPDEDGVFDEDFNDAARMSPKLKLAEDIMGLLPNSYIFRLAGLFGKQRIFAKYFQGRVCTTGDQPANFVHLDDVRQLLSLSMEHDLPESVYHVVAPEHPLKKEVILASAKKYQLELPAAFDPQDSFQKLVLGDRLSRIFNYRFKYPSPLEF